VVHGCGGSGYEAGNAGQFGSRKPTDHKSKGSIVLSRRRSDLRARGLRRRIGRTL
jgi:hypothetical protein